ncbi:hypothetical protein [Nocardiopsis sp. NPDC057823]|uniref:hypothetical protein n=1 Tax=Nocardiopsis sp. NPDC057823 TaxID=3346256 RepID=UPI00366E3B6F
MASRRPAPGAPAPGALDPGALPARLDLESGEAGRVRGFRRLVALCRLLRLGPTGAATPHDPPGTARRVAARVPHLSA